MSERSPGFACRFLTLVRGVGDRSIRHGGAPARRQQSPIAGLAKRDIADLAAGAEALPGTWHVETSEGETGGVARAWLRPVGDKLVPAFGFVRGDGVIMVRMSRADDTGNPRLLVFGAFASIVAALDAIHNDIAARQVRGGRLVVGVS